MLEKTSKRELYKFNYKSVGILSRAVCFGDS